MPLESFLCVLKYTIHEKLKKKTNKTFIYSAKKKNASYTEFH